jgi:hypothetical protein
MKNPSRHLDHPVVSVAILAALILSVVLAAVPGLQQAFERSLSRDAFAFCAELEAAQEQHHAEHGRYAASLGALGLAAEVPPAFRADALRSGDWERGWRLVLHRQDHRARQSRWSLCWTEAGFEPGTSTIPRRLVPLLPR